tara:strand:+ start:1118 stop:1303 length:186 start_codon:yes stop_codon:yes gene_type:complete
MKYKGKYFIVVEDQGILKSGMLCHCFDEQQDFVRMWFQNPIFSDMHEVKISKNIMHIFKER